MRLGIDLGGTKIEGIVLADDGTEIVRERIATPAGDYGATLQAIRNLVSAIESQAGARVPRVGVGIPGIISPFSGLIKNANSTWLNGHPLDRDLEAVLERPVRLENDANCFAVSEAVDGAGAGCAVVFGVILGTGVGGGIVIDGRPLRGRNAIGGEWGHNALPWPAADEIPGPSCYCGLTGCIETFLSGPGMTADFKNTAGRDTTPAEIVALAEDGDDVRPARPWRATKTGWPGHWLRSSTSSIPTSSCSAAGCPIIASLHRERSPSLWDRWIFSDHVGNPPRTQLSRRFQWRKRVPHGCGPASELIRPRLKSA